jgi:nucleoside-diphosphate-sugar epimerase
VKAFVSGATGFVGRHLVAELLGAGYVVFHLAVAQPASRRPREADRLERINVAGTRALLEHAAALGVGRLVAATCTAALAAGAAANGATAAAGLPKARASLARAHTQAVLPLQQQGLPLVAVALGRVFGPGDETSDTGRLLRTYARRRLLALPGAGASFDWTYVADAARALRLAAEHGVPGQLYRAAGPVVTTRAFLAAAQAATGLPGPRLWLPGGAPAGRDPNGGGGRPAEQLGWQPGDLGTGLAATVDWHLEQLSRPAAPPGPVGPGAAE